MKNYNEMANDVFKRRDEYITAQRKKRKNAIGITSFVMCFCLLAVIGFYNSSNGNLNSNSGFEANRNNNTIVINKIDNTSANSRLKMNICLFGDDFVPMSKQDLIEYYKTDVFPIVPDDLKEIEEEDYGIYRRNGGSGEVYWEQIVLNYCNSEFTRSINIELCKNKLPFSDYGTLDENNDKSIINRTPVNIGLIDEGIYMAEFLYRNVGFRIIFEGLSQEEMISVLTSIIKI